MATTDSGRRGVVLRWQRELIGRLAEERPLNQTNRRESIEAWLRELDDGDQ